MGKNSAWKLSWTAFAAPDASVFFDLQDGYVLDGLQFWTWFEGQGVAGGDGGLLAAQVRTPYHFQVEIAPGPKPWGAGGSGGAAGHRTVEMGDESEILVGVLGTDPRAGRKIAKAFWWSGSLRSGGEPPRELGSIDSMRAYQRHVEAQVDGGLAWVEGAPVPLRNKDEAALSPTQWDMALAQESQSRCSGYLKSISVSGYRGFGAPQTLELAVPNGKPGSGLTILVGANNSGKSAVWECFDTVSRVFTQEIFFSSDRRNSSVRDGVAIGLEWCNGQSLSVGTQNTRSSRGFAKWGDGTELELGDASLVTPVVAVPARRQFKPYFAGYENNAPNWSSQTTSYSRTDTRDGFGGRLIALDKGFGRERESFDQRLSEILGFRFEWGVDARDDAADQGHCVTLYLGSNAVHTTEGAGEGVVSSMFIVDALRDLVPGTLVVIDEPELSLHPEAVRRLRALLSEVAAESQVVIATHSPLMVNWGDIANGASVARIHKVGDDSRISQPSREVLNGIGKLTDDWRNPHSLGTEATEALFLRDGIVVVEGQEDVTLLPVVARQLGVEIPWTFFGWGASGHKNIPLVARLLWELGFERVVGLFDGGQDEAESLEKAKEQAPHYAYFQIPAGDVRDKDRYERICDGPSEGLYRKVLKKGLLDGDERVRPEFREEMTEVLEETRKFLEERLPKGRD